MKTQISVQKILTRLFLVMCILNFSVNGFCEANVDVRGHEDANGNSDAALSLKGRMITIDFGRSHDENSSGGAEGGSRGADRNGNSSRMAEKEIERAGSVSDKFNDTIATTVSGKGAASSGAINSDRGIDARGGSNISGPGIDPKTQAIEVYIQKNSFYGNSISTLENPLYIGNELGDKYLAYIDKNLAQSVEFYRNKENQMLDFVSEQLSSPVTHNFLSCNDCTKADHFISITAYSEIVAKNEFSKNITSEFTKSAFSFSESRYKEHTFLSTSSPSFSEISNVYTQLSKLNSIAPQVKYSKEMSFQALVQADLALFQNHLEDFKTYLEISKALLDVAIGFSPVAGPRDLYEAISGFNLMDGHKLSSFERNVAVFGALSFGVGSKILSITKMSSGIVKMATLFGASEKTISKFVHMSNLAKQIGITSREKFVNHFGRLALKTDLSTRFYSKLASYSEYVLGSESKLTQKLINKSEVRSFEEASELLEKSINSGAHTENEVYKVVESGEFTNYQYSLMDDKHIISNLEKRGWSKSQINETIHHPYQTIEVRDTRYATGSKSRLNEPATAYLNKDGSYVVRNDRTGDIVQISNKMDSRWRYPSWHPMFQK